MANKYGVRIYPVPDSDQIIIRQTIRRPDSPRYVIDIREDGMYRQTFQSVNDTESVMDAVRQALRGELIGELKS
jgi:hypothetical protein